MKEIRRIDNMKVRQYCINENYYTCGTCKEYENLLFNLCNLEEVTLDDLETIAADILVHSVWEKKAEEYGFNYDDLLKCVISDLINDCCRSMVIL